ncbi:FecCD family ABC transporter permease [Paenibacillus tarimensis]|uniref:FecCD family ABC transporter permease n=1 Tax=Paenibacillus tarimensis TaxID=416012 RepID=UPI001F29DBE6|nr:iron ABC transporter permease [Paenibacillus tarimensis]MCF2942858.1 iron ABC transporter permease [Paenibacillus tarimensis]
MKSLLDTPKRKAAGLAGGVLLLMLSMLAALLFGYHRFTLNQLADAMLHFDGSTEHLLIRSVRTPTVLIGALVGAALATAGAVMQVLTRNPLASPSVLGVNAGAVLAIVLALSFSRVDLGTGQLIWVAFAGAALTTLFVYASGSAGPGGLQPLKLTLAGAAVAAFATAITSGVMLLREESLSETLFWLVGSVSGRRVEHFTAVLPYIGAGLLLAFGMGRSLNMMALDDEVAKGLGHWTAVARAAAVAAVVLLAGGAVAVAGPIAFVGLIVPHICRYMAGGNHRWLIPYCAVYGALLLVTADLVSRFVLMPKEVPVGVTTAMLGVPFLIHLARRGVSEQ